MKFYYLLLIFIIFGCIDRIENESNQNEAEASQSKLDLVSEDEIFDQFFEKFKTDTSFQIERTKFPFLFKSWESNEFEEEVETKESINKENWVHKNFYFEESFKTRDVDAYSQQIIKRVDTVRIEYRGIDNGIRVDFKFVKIKGNWYFTLIEDYST